MGKEYVKAVYHHPADLTYMESISCEMLGWKNHKLQSRLLGEIPTTSDMQMIPHSWQKVKRIRVKEKSENPDLKLNIKETMIMVSGPITS